MCARILMMFAAVVAILMAFTSIRAAEPAEEEVTAESLIAGIPVLSPENEELTNFELTIESKYQAKQPLKGHIAWSRPNNCWATLSACKAGYPCVFFAQNKVAAFDATTASVLILKDSGLNFRWFCEKEEWKLSLGFNKKKQTESILIDIPSHFDCATLNSVITPRPNGGWRVEVISKSGESKSVLLFGSAPRYAIEQFRFTSKNDGDPLRVVLKDITFDSPTSSASACFPKNADFPEGLEVSGLSKEDAQSGKIVSLMQRFFRSFLSQAAIDQESLRKEVIFDRYADWDAAERVNSHYGPQLKALVEAQIQAARKRSVASDAAVAK